LFHSCLHGIDVPLFCPVGAVVALTFRRYDQGGHRLFDCNGIYTVTNNDGRWGMELVSTIITPNSHVDLPYPDAEMAANRIGEDGMLRYTNRIVPATAPDPEERFVGRRAKFSFGYGPREGECPAGGAEPGSAVPAVPAQLQLRAVRGLGRRQRRAVGRHVDQMGGYVRHTPDVTMISETRSISVMVYKDGRWGNAGGIRQVTYHDRSNSYPTVTG
jgi:hypothetical protein